MGRIYIIFYNKYKYICINSVIKNKKNSDNYEKNCRNYGARQKYKLLFKNNFPTALLIKIIYKL